MEQGITSYVNHMLTIKIEVVTCFSSFWQTRILINFYIFLSVNDKKKVKVTCTVYKY